MKKVSLNEFKERLLFLYGDQIKVVEETFVNVSTKCDFVDIDFGIWNTQPRSVLNGFLSRKRGNHKRKLTCQEKYGIDHISHLEIIQEKLRRTWANKSEKDLEEIQEKCKQTCLKNHGVEYSLQSKEIREKIKQTSQNKSDEEKNKIKEKRKQTCQEKYGFDNPTKSIIVKEKYRQAFLKNHGVENPSQSQEIKKQKIETCLKNYGVKYSFQSSVIKDKIKKSMIFNHGFDNPQKSKEISLKSANTRKNKSDEEKNKIKEKRKQTWANKSQEELKKVQEKYKQTCIKNYGVENPSQSQEIKNKVINTWDNKSQEEKDLIREKTEQTCLKNYGVSHHMQSEIVKAKFDHKQIQEKSHQTKSVNGSYGKSKQEDQFYEFLLTVFNRGDIIRQYRVNGWSIDFYIKSKNFHVQFDGDYYHGLDRSIEEIKLFKKPTDKTIFYTFNKDLKQNQWFKENNLKLIRITNKEFEKNLEEIKEKLGDFK